MRVVFMGTPSFAVPSLLELATHHDVVAVYTRPDKPSGRGRTPVAPPVKLQAQALGIPVMQPPTLRVPPEVALLAELRADVVCVAAYGMLLPDDVLAVPPMGCVNVHASLLPEYRGAAPVQRAILEGAEITGVSIMRVVSELDAGPYAAQASVRIGDMDADSLTAVLADVGAHALLEVLPRIEDGTVVWVAQDDALATYAPKITSADVALVPEISAEDALRRVRASSDSAPARIVLAGRRVRVVAASPSDLQAAPGTVVAAKDALALGTSSGSIELDAVKPEGRAEMTGAAYARGARLVSGSIWEPWA